MSNMQVELTAAPDSDLIELDDDDIELVEPFDLSDVTGGCRRCGCIGGVAMTHTTGTGFGIDPAFALLAMYTMSQSTTSKT